MPFVIQPDYIQMEDEDFLDKIDILRGKMKVYLRDVRVIPQMHKILGVR